MKDIWILLCCAGIAVGSCSVEAAPFTAVTVGAKPFSLAECDKLRPNATAVYSLSIWNRSGYPLWRSVCYWKGKP